MSTEPPASATGPETGLYPYTPAPAPDLAPATKPPATETGLAPTPSSTQRILVWYVTIISDPFEIAHSKTFLIKEWPGCKIGK